MKKDYQKSEDRAVEDFNIFDAIKVPYSGALITDKLDISLHSGKLTGYRISNKHTIKGVIPSCRLEEWDKDRTQALRSYSRLIRRIELESPGTGQLRKIIQIEQEDFLNLLSMADDDEED